MGIIPAKTPKAIKALYPNLIWNINTDKKEIYLTFDDGPTPEITTWVLAQLQDYNAKVTFFCIGQNIEKHPEIFKAILANGHSVGNHTYNHLNGWYTNSKAYLDNIAKCKNTIQSITKSKGQSTCFFRPPYGKLKPSQSKHIKALGYKIVMWDVLSFDWNKNISKEKCLKNVTDNTKAGSIVVFHDSVKASKNMKFSLTKTLEFYSGKGFSFKAL